MARVPYLPSVRREAAWRTSTPSRHNANATATTPTANKANESPSSSSFPPGREASAAAPPSCCRGQQHPKAPWQQVPPREHHANHEGEFVSSAPARNVFVEKKKRASSSSQPEVLTGLQPASHSTDRRPVVETRRTVFIMRLLITFGQYGWTKQNRCTNKFNGVICLALDIDLKVTWGLLVFHM